MPGRGSEQGVAALLAVWVVLLAFLARDAGAGPLGAAQQRCVRSMNRDLRKLAARVGKNGADCVRSLARGRTDELPPGGRIEACVRADRKGRAARARERLDRHHRRRCTGEDGKGLPRRPAFGATDPNTVAGAALASELALLHDLLGSDLEAAVALEGEGSTLPRCQRAVLKALLRCRDARLAEFNRCKKDGLRGKHGPAFESAQDLARCTGADPGRRVEKACGSRLGVAIQRKCAARGLDLSRAFPGSPAGGARDLLACRLREATACRTCAALEEADALEGACPACAPSEAWPRFGGDLSNTHQGHAHLLGPASVAGLAVKWVYDTTESGVGDVSTPPAVQDGTLYFPDWAGNLHAVDAATGTVLWKKSFATDTSSPGKFFLLSRNTPAVAGDLLYVGSQVNIFTPESVAPRDGAIMAAIDRHTGALVWSTRVDEHPGAQITQSPVVVCDRLYVGVSSMEELLAGLVLGYPCCTFRGSVVALDARTGELLWKTYTTPGTDPLESRDPNGYSGNAVWGGMPAVDLPSGSILVATGNNYRVPAAVSRCEAERLQAPDPPSLSRCDADDNYVDSVLSLDMETGAVRWAARLGGLDAWNAACGGIPFLPGFNPESCPDPTGPDFDFGEAPMLLESRIDGRPRRLAVTGQKSGVVWALDAATGELAWSRRIGPGGDLGGMIWGSATDGTRIYVLSANSEGESWDLVRPSGPETSTMGGILSALDPASGEILWQTPDPASAQTPGSITVAGGLVYSGSFDAAGTMHAFAAATGQELWSFASGGYVNTGPAIVGDVVYWGSGYARGGPAGMNNQLRAFALP